MPSRSQDAYIVDADDVEDTGSSNWPSFDADEVDVHEAEDDTEGHGKGRCP